MQVELNITRGDIFRFNLSKMFRLKSNLLVLAFAMIISAMGAWSTVSGDDGGPDWAVFILATLIGGLVGFTAIIVLSMFFVLLSSSVKSGVLGLHTYRIEDAGFREQTEANDSLHFWPSIHKIEKTRSVLVVQINPWLFHVLPRRGFDSEETYDAFFYELISHTAK